MNGVITANAIGTANAVASGTVTFARIFQSDGTTVVMDVQVGISGAAINFNSIGIFAGWGAAVDLVAHLHAVRRNGIGG